MASSNSEKNSSWDALLASIIQTLAVSSGLIMFAYLQILSSFTADEVLQMDLIRSHLIDGDGKVISGGARLILAAAQYAPAPIWNILSLTLLHMVDVLRALLDMPATKFYKCAVAICLFCSGAVVFYSILGLLAATGNLINLKAPYYPKPSGKIWGSFDIAELQQYSKDINDIYNISANATMSFYFQMESALASDQMGRSLLSLVSVTLSFVGVTLLASWYAARWKDKIAIWSGKISSWCASGKKREETPNIIAVDNT